MHSNETEIWIRVIIDADPKHWFWFMKQKSWIIRVTENSFCTQINIYLKKLVTCFIVSCAGVWWWPGDGERGDWQGGPHPHPPGRQGGRNLRDKGCGSNKDLHINNKLFKSSKWQILVYGAGATWSRLFCLEPEPTLFGSSRSRLQDLRLLEPPKKVAAPQHWRL